jgi:copper chaperone
MTSLNLKIEGMTCGHCVMGVQKALRNLDGVQVEDVKIGSAQLQFDPAKRQVDDILEAIRDQGYEPTAVASA